MVKHASNKRHVRWDPGAYLRGLWDDFDDYDYLAPATPAASFASEETAEDLSAPESSVPLLASPLKSSYSRSSSVAAPEKKGGGQKHSSTSVGPHILAARRASMSIAAAATPAKATTPKSADDSGMESARSEKSPAEEHDPNVIYEGHNGSRYKWRKSAGGKWRKEYLPRSGLTPRAGEVLAKALSEVK